MSEDTNEPVKQKWITPEQKKELRGIFKHEDEIWPNSYVQLWIPNDFNHYAIVLGFKALNQNGERVLVAGFKNPFGEDPEPLYLPADEYKHWCELPGLTEEMQAKQKEIWAEADKGNRMYPYPERTTKAKSLKDILGMTLEEYLYKHSEEIAEEVLNNNPLLKETKDD